MPFRYHASVHWPNTPWACTSMGANGSSRKPIDGPRRSLFAGDLLLRCW